MQFVDQSTITNGNSIVAWAWDFDNNGTTDATIANPIAAPTFSTDYQVTVTDAQGCKNTGTVKVGVNYIATTLSNDTSFCKGGSSNLLASGGVSYTWSPTQGLSASTH